MVEKSEKQSVIKDQNWGGRGGVLLARNSQLPRTKTGGRGDSWPETVSYQGPNPGSYWLEISVFSTPLVIQPTTNHQLLVLEHC